MKHGGAGALQARDDDGGLRLVPQDLGVLREERLGAQAVLQDGGQPAARDGQAHGREVRLGRDALAQLLERPDVELGPEVRQAGGLLGAAHHGVGVEASFIAAQHGSQAVEGGDGRRTEGVLVVGGGLAHDGYRLLAFSLTVKRRASSRAECPGPPSSVIPLAGSGHASRRKVATWSGSRSALEVRRVGAAPERRPRRLRPSSSTSTSRR
jgi:hypothetical protein